MSGPTPSNDEIKTIFDIKKQEKEEEEKEKKFKMIAYRKAEYKRIALRK